MSIADVTEDNILGLWFTAVAVANIADNAATAPETNVDTALMTADPTDTGNMSSNETGYTGYSRTAVSRDGTGFTVASGAVNPDAAITFPAGTGAPDTVTHFAWGKTGGGAADIYWSGTVSPNIGTGDGITPELTTATQATLD